MTNDLKKYRYKKDNLNSTYYYEIIKKYKNTCHIRLWINDEPTDVIYKKIKYNDLYLYK